MLNSDNQIFFNFSYFALRLLGKGLYSNAWTAISELVANGFDAKAENVKIYINAIDKAHSVIEIFDNGYGMDYKALSEKYALIGRDKRDDNSLDEQTKSELMGRKGIGKLAALYLSNKYYLVSKTSDEKSAWCLDASHVKDSDIPHLDKINVNEIQVESKSEWDKCKTGTMIKLMNVDLTNFGVQSLVGLKARLSDFYLLNALHGKIEVAFLTSSTDNVKFEQVEKSIAFKNMYCFFNNTNIDYSRKLNKTVRYRSSINSIALKPRSVIFLNTADFPQISGKKRFLKQDGTMTQDELHYEMKGWIGIHASINKEDAIINDPEYLKNKVYRPNNLRLYVRNKLAVENFLEYIKNTQAFSNYIEGEISFDILDDNHLPDIATSNRQKFIENDERIKLLIDILKPIINSLIRERVKIGAQIRDEEIAYYEEIKRQKEEERRREEEARKKAEEEKTHAILQLKNTERQTEVLNEKLKNTKLDLKSEKKRSTFLMDNLSVDQLDFAKNMHMVKINLDTINKIIKKIILKKSKDKLTIEAVWNDIKSISYSVERIKVNLAYGMNAKFNTEEEKIKADLFEFILEYCENILKHHDEINIKVKNNVVAKIEFAPQNIAIILENIVSNSIKAKAKNLMFLLDKEDDFYKIDVIDDGDGIDKSKISDTNSLFEFGKGYTELGSGVGMYHIKEIIEKHMCGTVSINELRESGFEINMRIKA